MHVRIFILYNFFADPPPPLLCISSLQYALFVYYIHANSITRYYEAKEAHIQLSRD